jgi:hypothetical protein
MRQRQGRLSATSGTVVANFRDPLAILDKSRVTSTIYLSADTGPVADRHPLVCRVASASL